METDGRYRWDKNGGENKKEKETLERGDEKFVTKLKNNIQEQTSSDLASDDLFQHKPFSFSLFQHLTSFEGLSDYLKPSLSTHSLQIHY